MTINACVLSGYGIILVVSLIAFVAVIIHSLVRKNPE